MPRSKLKFRMNTKLGKRLKKGARLSGRPPEQLVASAIQWYLDSKQFGTILRQFGGNEMTSVNSVAGKEN